MLSLACWSHGDHANRFIMFVVPCRIWYMMNEMAHTPDSKSHQTWSDPHHTAHRPRPLHHPLPCLHHSSPPSIHIPSHQYHTITPPTPAQVPSPVAPAAEEEAAAATSTLRPPSRHRHPHLTDPALRPTHSAPDRIRPRQNGLLSLWAESRQHRTRDMRVGTP